MTGIDEIYFAPAYASFIHLFIIFWGGGGGGGLKKNNGLFIIGLFPLDNYQK